MAIEFLLHPPSPEKCILPSVSSLLKEEEAKNTELPLLCLPSPSLSSTSSVLEPIEPSCNSPSLSPLMNSLSLEPSKFLLPLPTDSRRSRSSSISSTTSSLLNYLSDDSSCSSKRKRGRPPNSPSSSQQNFTFVTPTVWDVHQQQQQKAPKETDKVTFHWSTPNIKDQIPKKKRGRKPKTQLAGNFCFVWRDLTARRGANKKKKHFARTDEKKGR